MVRNLKYLANLPVTPSTRYPVNQYAPVTPSTHNSANRYHHTIYYIILYV